jgi:putative oxidoreductase
MWKGLLRTSNDPVVTLARVVLGVVMFPHAAQHALGWYGGYGFNGMMGYFTSLGIPPVFGVLAIVAEVYGSLGLIFGLGGRVAAAGIASVMAVAVVRVHLPIGFFMNWLGNQKGEGYEYHLLAIALALIVIVRGSGRWSLDRVLARERG